MDHKEILAAIRRERERLEAERAQLLESLEVVEGTLHRLQENCTHSGPNRYSRRNNKPIATCLACGRSFTP